MEAKEDKSDLQKYWNEMASLHLQYPIESFLVDIEKAKDLPSGTFIHAYDEKGAPNFAICKEGETIKIFRIAKEENAFVIELPDEVIASIPIKSKTLLSVGGNAKEEEQGEM